MFLTKKIANKTKQKAKINKALGGWDDEQQDVNEISNTKNNKKYPANLKQTDKYHSMDVLDGGQVRIPSYSQLQSEQTYKITLPPPATTNKFQSTQKNTKKQQMFYTSAELSELNSIQFQRKLVDEITMPGGIRLKPNQKLLAQFLEECRSLQISIIGSLLISKLYLYDDFQLMAKSLYTIQFLCKKNQQYLYYFKLNAEKVKDCEEPSDNSENFRKIKKTVLNLIGDTFRSEDKDRQINDDGMEFKDPGYGKDKGVIADLLNYDNNSQNLSQQSKPTPIKNKLASLQAEPKKKALMGPGSKASSNNQTLITSQKQPSKIQNPSRKASEHKQLDLFDINETGSVKANTHMKPPHKQSFNLLDDDISSQGNKDNSPGLTFEQLIKNQNKSKKNSEDLADFTF